MESEALPQGALHAGEVVQVIMQEDGQIVMPEGQFIQLNTEDGHTQYIQLTGNESGNQLIQLLPDCQAQILQMMDDGSGMLQSTQHLTEDGEEPLGEESVEQPEDAATDSLVDGGPETLADGAEELLTDDPHDPKVICVKQMKSEDGNVDAGPLDSGAAGADEQLRLVIQDEGGFEVGSGDSNGLPQTNEEMRNIHMITMPGSSGTQVQIITYDGDQVIDGLAPVKDTPGSSLLVGDHYTQPQITISAAGTSLLKSNVASSMAQSVHVSELDETLVTAVATKEKPREHKSQKIVEIGSISILETDESQHSSSGDGNESNQGNKDTLMSSDSATTSTAEASGSTSTSSQSTAPSQTAAATLQDAKPVMKVIDTSCPISLTCETVVVIDGKKCVLRVDPETNHLVAYPYKVEGGKKRGRPRKLRDESGQPVDATGSDDASGNRGLSEQENSAAEGLLGLSDADGVRRSNRARKRNKMLSEYEMGKIEGMEDDEDTEDSMKDEDEPSAKRGRGRPPRNPNVMMPTKNTLQSLLANMGYPVKRGRGRPRRQPLPNSGAGPIPAFIIPSPGGQAVMMAPVQNLNQLAALKNRPLAIRPKPSDSNTLNDNPPVVIQNADGSLTQVVCQSQPVPIVSDTQTVTTDGAAEQNAQGVVSEGIDETTLDGPMTEGDTTTVDADDDGDDENGDDGAVVEDDRMPTVIMTDGTDGESGAPPAAIFQLPSNIVPLLLPKQEPIKIGLKATEQDLEKIRCPRCDFQAYYMQQYQQHITTLHGDDLLKCKCCSFHTFEKEDLIQHFKDNHPRCICPECDFMTEHAYGIKRHMVRHSLGCECEICGKRYKDQYILKMHIKMVHMPADVLYGCEICSKKFTRKAHLKRHLRIHEPEKPFKCPHCDYRGCERSDITKHLLIHEDPKHVCEVCGKAFRHIKNKELHVKRHKGQRDYKCGVCDFYGYTFTDIRKHIERKHSDAKNALCNKCSTSFKNQMLLKEHQNGHCEMLLIEQALAVAQADGSSTIRIPSGHIDISSGQLGIDGNSIMIDGNHVNITVEQVALPEDADQLALDQDLVDGQLSISEGQVISQAEFSQLAASSHIINHQIIGQDIHAVKDLVVSEGMDEEDEVDDLDEEDMDNEVMGGHVEVIMPDVHEVITAEGLGAEVDQEGVKVISEEGQVMEVGEVAEDVDLDTHEGDLEDDHADLASADGMAEDSMMIIAE